MKRLSKMTRDYQAVRQDDAAWFRANPDRNYRLRRPHEIELREMERERPAEASASYTAYTVVHQVCPGHRLRMHCWSGTKMIDAEELAHDLFDQLMEPFRDLPVNLAPLRTPLTLRLAHGRGDQA